MKEETRKKLHVDFAAVEPGHGAIHDRLRNWARWVVVRPQARAHPMFRLYRAPPQWEPRELRESCDLLDAARMELLVRQLPPKHRGAIRWSYVWRYTPAVAVRELGLSYDGLYRHLRDGRQMLVGLVD